MAKLSNDDLSFRSPNFDKPTKSKGKGTATSDTRDPYQRDLGRIVHSASFRRLQTKTQVMGTGEGDFHRTRLTHTLEVGQIGRGIVWNLAARKKNKNFKEFLPSTELTEAICYAHDLGHPPYGHAGEKALHSKMRNFGGFEGNAQTIRILTKLEKYYSGQGIRPTRRLLLGVLKYPVAYGEYSSSVASSKPPKCYYDDEKDLISAVLSIFSETDASKFRSLGENGKPTYKSFDCSIMELADDIAYGVHDLEDGIGRGMLRREEVGEKIKNGFIEGNVEKIYDTKLDVLLDKLFSTDSCERKHAISLLVGYFILKIEVEAQNQFDNKHLDLKATVTKETRKLLDHLSKEITFKGIVNRREVQTLEFKGKKIVSDLFDAFASAPLKLAGSAALDPFNIGVQKILEKQKNENASLSDFSSSEGKLVARAISDFVAGMTNPYAERYHRRLFEPGFGSSTDEL